MRRSRFHLFSREAAKSAKGERGSVAGVADPGRHPSSRAGLTLIEVLLAVAILSAGLVMLLLSTGRCLGVARKARQYERARHLLDLVEVVSPLDLSEKAESEEEGAFDPPYAGYRWRRQVAEQEAEDDRAKGLYEVRTRVMWSDRGQESFEEVVRLVYAPDLRGSATAPSAAARDAAP